jgi:hypothetical protein
MAKSIQTEILIHASPEKVWSVLTNFEDYPSWNPFIRSLQGQVAVGQNIRVHIVPPGMKGMVLHPTVLNFEPGRQFRWIGHLFFKGLFDGEHVFELVDNGDGTTTFKHHENFRGILVPLFKNMLDKNTREGFEVMNAKLKEIAQRKENIPAGNP